MTDVLGSSLLLGLAWFAAANALVTIACWLAAAATTRVDSRTGVAPLVLRLLPAFSSIVMLALFLPSHWRFEPIETGETNESFGFLLYLAAAAGGWLLVRSAGRMVAVARAGWELRRCAGLPRLRDDAVFEVRHLAGMSLVGVLRTRILVGHGVVRDLSPEELDVALAHEAAHRSAWDNLKRWMLYCAPDFLGLTRTGRLLERRWHTAAECSADERAVGGNRVRALDLASALVKVSRLSQTSPAWAMSPTWSTLHDPPLLDMRVRRLVGGPIGHPQPPVRLGRLLTIGLVGVGLLASNADVAAFVHGVSETLVARLP